VVLPFALLHTTKDTCTCMYTVWLGITTDDYLIHQGPKEHITIILLCMNPCRMIPHVQVYICHHYNFILLTAGPWFKVRESRREQESKY